MRVVFFDIGGVLELTPATGWQARWGQRLALGADAIDGRLAELWQRAQIGTVSAEEIRTELRRALRLDEAEVQALQEELWEEYLGQPNQELINYFASLSARTRTAILSNSAVGARERERERYDFESMCERIVYSHEVGVAKPDVRIYHLACEQLCVDLEASLLVDDVPENIAAAQAVGMTGVLFRDNAQVITDVERWLGG